MKRNDLSCLAHSAVSSSVSIFDHDLSGWRTTPLIALLAVAAAAWSAPVADAQAVNFGSVNVCPSGTTTPAPCSKKLAVSFTVAASGTLGTPNVFTLGMPDLDFTLATGSTCVGTVVKGATCAVAVTFAPRFAGPRNGAVQIVDGSGNLVATAYIYGIGLAPQLTFQPGTRNVLGSGVSIPKVDGGGNVYVADIQNSRVEQIVAVDGRIPANPTINILGNGFAIPHGVAVDGSGNVFVADTGNFAVKEILAAGGYTTVNTLGSGFDFPFGVAVDGSGNVFVGDHDNGTVKEMLAVNGSIPANPTIKTLGISKDPFGVAVDASGNVFAADSDGFGRVREGLSEGGYTTVNTLFTGLTFLTDIAVDGSGNVYVTDLFGEVEKLDLADPPTFAFASTHVGATSSDSPQSVIFQNIGNQPLSGTGTLSDSTDFRQVLGTSSIPDCTYDLSLAPGAQCNLSLSFTPQSAGLLKSTLTLSDNSLNGNSATQTISLSGIGRHANQTITFNPIAPQYAGTQLTLAATASSGLPIDFASTTMNVCAVSGNTATLLAAGCCDIHVTQAGNASYFAAITGQTFLVHHANQTITFSAIPGKEVGTIFNLTASATSGLPVTFASATPTTCSVSGTTADPLKTGPCTIQASQAGNAAYFAAGPVTRSFTVR